MPLQVTYERHPGHVCVRAHGSFYLASAQDCVMDLIAEAQRHGVKRILYDITCVHGWDRHEAPLIVRFTMGQFVATVLPKGIWLAMVETPQQHSPDGFDETVMVNRGALVKVTTNRNDALIWLGVTAPDHAREAAHT